MESENPTGADNQQETARSDSKLEPAWVTGFVDGEGCFSVSVHRNPHVRQTRGWQLQAAFQVYQHVHQVGVLEELVTFFGCGRIRAKGPTSAVMTYSVWSLRDLSASIIPFFERHPLIVKAQDFALFADIVMSMKRKEHLTDVGFERLVRAAFAMNANGKQRSRRLEEVLEGSSETVRQAPYEPFIS